MKLVIAVLMVKLIIRFFEKDKKEGRFQKSTAANK